MAYHSEAIFRVHTGGNDIVDDQHLLTGLDGIGLHLEEILAVLLLVGLGHAGTGQLALLAHGDEAGTQAQGQARAHQEAAGLETHDDIGLLAVVALEDLQFQGADESLVQRRVGEDREDILKQDAGGREVRELA